MPRTGQCVALAMLCAIALAARAGAAVFVVTTTADSGVGSLRQAILDANALAGVDTITFAIPTVTVPVIVPATALPAVSAPAVLDATVQLPAGLVELAGTTANGLTLTGGGTTVRGFVIHGFTTAGIGITGPGGNVIQGNLIGTDVTGTLGASPSATGIDVSGSSGNHIGGTTPGAGNLISGNSIGINVHGSSATGNVIEGNFIGTAADGITALGNSFGVQAFLTGANTVGGTNAGAGNVIAGNGFDGIALSASNGWTLQGNLVGLGADGVTAVPNGRHGIRILNTSHDTRVGGDGPNELAFNGGAGVILATNAGVANSIRSNVIHDNGALGIDLGTVGVTANDAGDADTGPNGLQNFPVLDTVLAAGAQVGGSLDSTANAKFTIEVFASHACDTTGYGEGDELVATLDVATDGGGHAAFTTSLKRTVDVTSEFLTATATDAAGSTSEFSPCLPAPPPTTTTTTTTSSSTTSSLAATTTSTSTSLAPSTTTSSTAPASTTSTSATPTTSSTTTSSTTSTDPDSSTTTSTGPSDTATSTSSTAAPSTTTTSSSTTTVPAVTSSTTTTTAASTTSTIAGSTTTSTTQLDASTSTTSTLDPTTTTSTAILPTSTTSTSAPATTSTSTSLPVASSTSTSLAATTSTSTTSSTTAPDASTSSSTTTVPGSTSTSSTSVPGSTSTTTTSEAPGTSSTSSTAVAVTSTTSSSTLRPATTSTTLAPCVGEGCGHAGCGISIDFAALRCRLGTLADTVDRTDALSSMRPAIDRHLARARVRLDAADARCAAAKRAPARRVLRQVRKRLVAVGRVLRSSAARRTLPRAATEPVMSAATTLATDTRTLAQHLACP